MGRWGDREMGRWGDGESERVFSPTLIRVTHTEIKPLALWIKTMSLSIPNY
ncbi:MAG: hypothetical protein F6J90_12150 [Moorea sp. SIOASIH]|uniref:hypothetical protein n=1 Tax=Moorena sp. SIOASIH TaxID=2607817 RepID=UPI0013BD3F0C|nr:hypothetical protein [Moorena sp. SIOASIH]NEO37022.1 hypothetical protein [Moorena sp. SIOASIH]